MLKSRFAFALLISFFMLTGRTPLFAGPSLQERFEAEVGRYHQEAKAALVGVCVVDLASGKTLVAINDHDRFKPASNQKLVTTAFSLARLGGSFQFTTEAYLDGNDLWVFGSGDPTFGDPVVAADANSTIYVELDRWAQAIKKACPGGIAGNIIVSPTFTRNQAQPQEGFRHSDWPKEQYHDWYEAPVCGLNFNNNCVDVGFRASKGGEVVPEVSPSSRFMTVINQVKVETKTEKPWGLQLSQDDAVMTLKGEVGKNGCDPVFVAVNQPALLFGRVLADRLVAAGVRFGGTVVPADPAAAAKLKLAAPVARTEEPLAEVLRRANKRSLNMAAECVFLRAGDGTWAGSAKAMTETLTKTYGLSDDDFVISDGSGMSRQNGIAPAAIAKLLTALAASPNATIVADSLPISGEDGTLKKRMHTPPYAGRVLGKTGWITGVSCLSGYVLDKEKKPAVVFSILCNKVPAPAKPLQDRLCEILVDWLDAK